MSSLVQRPPCFLLASVLAAAGCKLYQQEEGDAAIDTPCLESAEALDPEGSNALGISESRLLGIVSGTRSNALIWTGRSAATRIEVTVSGASARYIRSRINPLAPDWQRPGCSDHVEIRGRLDVTTPGGELAESVSDMRLLAYHDEEARGTFILAADALRGTYAPTPRAGACLERFELRVLFTGAGVHGTLTDVVRTCGGSEATEMDFAGARWGSRWQNY